MDQKNLSDRDSFWLARQKDWSESGLTQKKWCEKQGITLSTFKYWRKKLIHSHSKQKPSCPPTFIEISSQAETERMEPKMEQEQEEEVLSPRLRLQVNQCVVTFYELISATALEEYLQVIRRS